MKNRKYFKCLNFFSYLLDIYKLLILNFFPILDNSSCKAPKGQSHPQKTPLPQISAEIIAPKPITKIAGSKKKSEKLISW